MKRTDEHASARVPLPMSREEMGARGWSELDVLLVTGDAYIDHPAFGAAVIGRVLEADGLRVGILAQPDWRDPHAFEVMGRPRLFCGVTAGNLDSMLAHYTAARHKRRDDAYTAGGHAGRRPNLATVVYTQCLRRAFPGIPVVLGGIEASLRRVAHYDYWQDKLRPSVLIDAKADLLVYGMGEAAIREIAGRFIRGQGDLSGIPGTARVLGASELRDFDPEEVLELPSWDVLQADTRLLLDQTRTVEAEQNPYSGKRILQRFDTRAVVVEPPAPPLSSEDLDWVYERPYSRAPHPGYAEPIPAWEMIRDSVTVVRGCAGGCSFCGLGLHQGRFLSSRSEESVLREIASMAACTGFSGTVSDLGGPSANLYGCENGLAPACRSCRRASCLFPRICPRFRVRGAPATRLLRRAATVPGVRHVFVASGVRMDVALETPDYLQELVRHHVSGHLKVAPEHLHPDVLQRMRKPGPEVFERFRRAFEVESRAAGRQQYLIPYFISSFPGCTEEHMRVIGRFLGRENWRPQQVQDYIPLPMTPAAAMYVTGLDYETGTPIPVARGLAERRQQMRYLSPGSGGRTRGQGPHPPRRKRKDSR